MIIKAEFKSTLGINNLGGMGSYLVLPGSLGGIRQIYFVLLETNYRLE